MNERTYCMLENKVGAAKAFRVAFPNLPKSFWQNCWFRKLVEISKDLPENHVAIPVIVRKIETLVLDIRDVEDEYLRIRGKIKEAFLKKLGTQEENLRFWEEAYLNMFADSPLRDLAAGKIMSLNSSLEQWLSFMGRIGKSDNYVPDGKWVHLPLFLGQILALPITCYDWVAIREHIHTWYIGYELKKDLEYGCLGKIIELAEELEKTTKGAQEWKNMFDLWKKVFSMSINFEEEKNQALISMVKAARKVIPEHRFHCWEQIFGNLVRYGDRVKDPEKIRAETLKEIGKAEARPSEFAYWFESYADSSDQHQWGKFRQIMLKRLKSKPIVVKTVGSWIRVVSAQWGNEKTSEVNAVVAQKFRELWSRKQPIPLSFKHLLEIAEGSSRRKCIELLDLVMPRLVKAAGSNIIKLGKIFNLPNLSQAHQDEIGKIIRKQL